MSRHVAFHEAGHALAAVLTGTPLAYVTVVADQVGLGHANVDHGTDWHESARWVAHGVVCAAGMVAETIGGMPSRDGRPDIDIDWLTDWVREEAVAGGGQGSRPVYDTATLRWAARAVWYTAQDQPLAVLGPEFDPAWAEHPDGVRDIAAYCWAKTVRLLCANAGTLEHLAGKLDKAKTLTGPKVGKVITGRHRRHQIPPDLVGTDFWLADYSRLVWRPYGMCRQKVGAR